MNLVFTTAIIALFSSIVWYMISPLFEGESKVPLKMNQDDLDTLTEVRQEIRRINQAAMRTIFNPAATEALEELMEKIGEGNDDKTV